MIRQSATLTPEEISFWNAALRGRDFGDLTPAWTEAVREAGPRNLEIAYLQAFEGEERRALVVVHVLRRFDLSGYMGPAIKRLLAPLAKIGVRPLSLNLAFL